ncbi:hypothetical protein [Gemmobacter sp. 24YEA27]|uniref:hypothetical protein n=1 Tax=Gemmobacter sp. 24YEA27 TaxID=3040672 RepID=UPI0024B35ED0|nr:hypothetical protein [Gemmobacter sp. 24YEA27]
MSDHLLINGHIHTMDPALPQARAILIRDGIIAAVGGDDIAALAHPEHGSPTLAGGSSCPGFRMPIPISSPAAPISPPLHSFTRPKTSLRWHS